jgi:hypothetical protein
MIEEMTQTRYWETTPVTYSQIPDVFWHQDSKMISNHALEHIVQQIENVKTVIGMPMEAEKATVAAAEFHHWFDQLPRAVDRVRRGLICNTAEIGCSEYSDAR